MRPAGLFFVSIRKTGGPNSALQRSDAGGSIWAGPLYTAKHLFCCMHFFIATVGPFKRLYMQCAMTMRKLPARASDGSFRRIRGDGWAVRATQPGAAVHHCGGTGVQAKREAAVLQPRPRQNPHNEQKSAPYRARTFVAGLWWR